VDAKYLGFDLSTTGLAAGVRGSDGAEDFASVSMVGATQWHGQPAFDLEQLPQMILGVMEKLKAKNWKFSAPGALSFSVRQHDMAVLDKFNGLLMPALSWQCNAAVERTKWINERDEFGRVIGKVEERFILPKILWAIDREPDLHPEIGKVMTTGDYIAFSLTGIPNLSTSDAYCNGLLDKMKKCLATEVIGHCRLFPHWFPPVIDSGREVGPVRIQSDSWRQVCTALQGWKVISCLGDNHAGAVGCGLNSDSTIVISAGTSGTIVRIGHWGDARQGGAACFEYYDEELLLMMMARCAAWYEDFVRLYGAGKQFKEIDREIDRRILEGPGVDLLRLVQVKKDNNLIEVYPNNWINLPLASQAASAQASIALELLLLVKKMLAEVVDSETGINKVVLTGGLSQSAFFSETISCGLELLQPGLKLFRSDHNGPLAYKAAALGALINAIAGESGGNISDTIGKYCPTSEVQSCGQARGKINTFLSKHLN
jgi:sugar (pentulose or hexulose) kinase